MSLSCLRTLRPLLFSVIFRNTLEIRINATLKTSSGNPLICQVCLFVYSSEKSNVHCLKPVSRHLITDYTSGFLPIRSESYIFDLLFRLVLKMHVFRVKYRKILFICKNI